MVIYICDACQKNSSAPFEIQLKGYVGQAGAILLPSQFQERQFCSPTCFVEWIKMAAKLKENYK